MKRTIAIVALFLLGGCSALDKVGDTIDEKCEKGVGTLTQSYIDPYNDYLAGKGRKFRIDGITCI